MRKFVIVIVVLVIIIGVTAVALFNLDRIVNSRKDYFISKAEFATGRQIEVGEIGVSIWGGIGIQLDDVTVSDDPSFTDGNFIQANQLKVNVALFPLLKKELKVKKIILKKPVFTLVRNADGKFNFDSLIKTGLEQPAQAGETSVPSGDEGAGAAVAGSNYALFVAMANINDGRVHFLDQTDNSEIHLDKIDFAVKDLRMDKPVEIELSAVLLPEPEAAGRSNLKLTGWIGPVGDPPVPEAIPIELDISIDPISLAEVGRIPLVAGRLPEGLTAEGPVRIESRLSGTAGDMSVSTAIDLSGCNIQLADRFNKSDNIPFRLETDLQKTGDKVTINRLTTRLHTLELTGSGTVALGDTPRVTMDLKSGAVDLSGWDAMLPQLEQYDLAGNAEVKIQIDGAVAPGSFPPLQGRAALHDVSFQLPRSPRPIEDLNGEVLFRSRGKEIFIDSLRLAGLDGTILGSGRLDLGQPKPRFLFDSRLRGLDLTRLLVATPAGSSAHFSGRLDLDFLAGGQGTKWADISQSLEGDGNIAVLKGIILNFNLAQYILDSVSDVIGSQQLVSSRLKQAYPQVFTARQTSFKKVESSLAVQNGRVYLPNTEMDTGDYTIRGETNMRLDGVLDSRGVLVLSDRLSADIVKDVQYAAFLKNKAGRLEIPFSISGKLPKVKVTAVLDGLKIQESVIKPEVDKLKSKLLNKLFNKKK